MSGVHVSMVGRAHGYTRSDVPWQIDDVVTPNGLEVSGGESRRRLIRFISGGGMRTFGKTVEQVGRERRQRRFLVFAAVVAAVWLGFLIY